MTVSLPDEMEMPILPLINQPATRDHYAAAGDGRRSPHADP
ncbi:hypothetical protein [Rhizobium sp. BK377]|nr:hypothetical protein [Rhizobium sp. BK377]MBB3463044.1 hypothetical protein [Rhizobium sp. BK377]